MNRRKFLTTTAKTAAVAAALPYVPKLAASPALRDDTGRLQAMIDAGKPILKGEYVLRSPLIIRNKAFIEDCRFDMHGSSTIQLGLFSKGSYVRSNIFTGTNRDGKTPIISSFHFGAHEAGLGQ